MKISADRRRDRAAIPPPTGDRRSRSPWKRLALPLADIAAVSAAIYLAFALRLDEPFALNLVLAALPLSALPIVVRLAVNRVLGLYAHSWRYVGMPEMLRLGVGVAVGSLVMLGVVWLTAIVWPPFIERIPRSFWILEAGLSLVLMTGVRITPRLLSEFRVNRPADSPARSRAILYGAGTAGAMMARNALRQPSAGMLPVAFLDDDPREWGKQHAGVRVRGGLDAMADVKRTTKAELLLITMPGAPGAAVRKVAEAALELGLRIRTVPSLEEMLNGSLDPQMTRPLRLEDLLRRQPVTSEAMASLTSDLADEVVLVTGAAGSIGSELSRQLLTVRPRRLILLDRAEGPLYELQRDIDSRQEATGVKVATMLHLADITNRGAMSRLMDEIRPSVIFHAAAYKHVSVMEEHPASAVEVNVGGTLSLLDAAEEHGVERFVLISTDKAVEPTGVMGASKRTAELLVAEYSKRLQRPWVSVRFGNVLGSSGSVVPIFERQLEKGEPLTITDKEMTRFFMTIPEAVHLILQASTMARPGDLFVLDMGEPVKILDLARDLIRLRGRTDHVPMRFTGLRPGERLHEALFFRHEDVQKTGHPKVFRIPATPPRNASARVMAGRLLEMAEIGDASLHSELMQFVTESDLSARGAKRVRPATTPAAKRSTVVGILHP